MYEYTMATVPTHKDNGRYCKVSFPTEDDMDEAIGTLIYESDKGFSGVSENSLIISREQCILLEHLQEEGQLSFHHLD